MPESCRGRGQMPAGHETNGYHLAPLTLRATAACSRCGSRDPRVVRTRLHPLGLLFTVEVTVLAILVLIINPCLGVPAGLLLTGCALLGLGLRTSHVVCPRCGHPV